MADLVTIPVDFLTELLNIRREHFKVCDTFKIPEEIRGNIGVGDGINERIRQYTTSYIMRKTIVEKQAGSAFREQIAEVPDITED